MEDKEQPLAIVETVKEKKICKCCGRELPLSNFDKRGIGYRNYCRECLRKENGVSERFAQFTSRELLEELRSRGYKGTLKYVKVEEIKL